MSALKHMLYYNGAGKYLDHGRYLEAVVGEIIHPFHTNKGPVNWKVLQVDDTDSEIIKVAVEVLPK